MSSIDKKTLKSLAGIEYHGSSGTTMHCLQAITRLIHFGDVIEDAWLLTARSNEFGEHCFLLNMACGDPVAIKSGFSSGYGGEGPRGLSTAIEIFKMHEIDLQEYEVDRAIIERIDCSCLTTADLENIRCSKKVHATKTVDYLWEWNSKDSFGPNRREQLYPATVNFGLLDERIFDLGLSLFENPDNAISTAFRRLEDTLRERTGLNTENSGQRLVTRVFEGKDSALHWDDENPGEHGGKAGLFKAVFLAFRNPRAHRELRKTDREALREFMLINELFCLEAISIDRPKDMTTEASIE
tara:strand:+ start:43930 stop:44823 length:894 start_codon:yes stop_codon:yes gene_type:complete